jgi:hypothetical protein
MIISIGGEAVDYQRDSIDLDNAIGERSTASFSIIDKEGNLTFQKGQQVKIQVVSDTSQLAKWNDDDLSQTWEE